MFTVRIAVVVLCLCVSGSRSVLARPLLSHKSQSFQDRLGKRDVAPSAHILQDYSWSKGISDLQQTVEHGLSAASPGALLSSSTKLTENQPLAIPLSQGYKRLQWSDGSKGLLELLHFKAAAGAAARRMLSSSDGISPNIVSSKSLNDVRHNDVQRMLQQQQQQAADIADSHQQPQPSCSCTCSNSSSSATESLQEIAAAPTPTELDAETLTASNTAMESSTDDYQSFSFSDQFLAQTAPSSIPAGTTGTADGNQIANSTITTTAAVGAGAGDGGSIDGDSSSGQVLLMGVKVAPIPADVLLQRMATAGNSSSSSSDLEAAFLHGAAAAAASSLNITSDHVIVSLQSRLTVALQLPGRSRSEQTPSPPAAATAAVEISSSNSSSSDRPMNLSRDTSGVPHQHGHAVTQAVAEFLEETAGSSSVLVSVNLLQLDDRGRGDSSSSSSSISGPGGADIALAGISALGDLPQSVAAAAAMHANCPQLFDRGAVLSMTDGEDYDRKNQTSDYDSDSYSSDGMLWSSRTACEKLLYDSYQAVLGSSSSSSSSSSGGLFDVTVVLPLEVNIKLKIMVKIPNGEDSQQLAAAAAAWLHSDEVEQLLQQHGLHAGLGSPARLITILPRKVTSGVPGVAGFANGSLPVDWKHESGAIGSGRSSSRNGSLDMAVEIPTAAGAGGDQRVGTQTLIAVVTVVGSATLGAAAALGVVFRARRKRRLLYGGGGNSSSSSRDGNTAKGHDHSRSSTGARRRRRTRGVVKRHSKYLPAGCTPPLPEPTSLLLMPRSTAAATAAGWDALAGQQLISGCPGQQEQQQQQEGLPTADAPTGNLAVAAAAAVERTSSSTSNAGTQLPRPQLLNSNNSGSIRNVSPGMHRSLLCLMHSAPAAAAAAAAPIADVQGYDYPPVAEAAAAAAPMSSFFLRRYWSYGQQVNRAHSPVSRLNDLLPVSRSDLCSDSVSSAVRLDLQQQQEHVFSRSSSRSSRSSSSSSSNGSHIEADGQPDGDVPNRVASCLGGSSREGGSALRLDQSNIACSSQLLSTNSSSGSSSGMPSGGTPVSCSLDQQMYCSSWVSPFQLHYNFEALKSE